VIIISGTSGIFCRRLLRHGAVDQPVSALLQAGNFRPEYVEYLITVDVHSPAKARVNAALPQIDAWYNAFGIKKSDKLFVPKKKRAQIW
jgi:putative endopeptidase